MSVQKYIIYVSKAFLYDTDKSVKPFGCDFIFQSKKTSLNIAAGLLYLHFY